MPSSASSPPFTRVPGSDAILKPGARIVFGEVHGTREAPELVAAVACLAARLGPVRVGLEISRDEQPRLDAFVASSGSAADRDELLAGSHWTRDVEDGRSSVAMLDLIEATRSLRSGGADIAIVAFDVTSQGTDDDDRDRSMARALAARFELEPRATFLILVGNVHARKARHDEIDGPFMAQELVATGHEVTTLDVSDGAGTFWVCTLPGPLTGPQAMGFGPAPPRGITLAPTSDGAFDGNYSIGAPTFSPPAARAMTEEEEKLAEMAARVADEKRTRPV